MALRYRKRKKYAGSSNTYTTTSYSPSRGYNSSVTTKTGNSTVTQSKYGTRVTQKLGNGWSNTSYVRSAYSQWKRKHGKKQKLSNAGIYLMGIGAIMHWLGIFYGSYGF